MAKINAAFSAIQRYHSGDVPVQGKAPAFTRAPAFSFPSQDEFLAKSSPDIDYELGPAPHFTDVPAMKRRRKEEEALKVRGARTRTGAVSQSRSSLALSSRTLARSAS